MEIFHAKPVKEIDADDYLDYHLYRPRCESKDGVRKYTGLRQLYIR